MSILRNLLNNFMPHEESRRIDGTISALNGEVALAVNGDSNATVSITTTAAALTYTIEGSYDGINYVSLPAYILQSAGAVFATAPVNPVLLEAVTAACTRVFSLSIAGVRNIRVRASAFTSGSINVSITTDTCSNASPFVETLEGNVGSSVTGLVGATASIVIPAVAGLRIYVSNIVVTRIASTVLVAAAAPVAVSITNLTNIASLSFGQDAAPIGSDKVVTLTAQAGYIAASAVGASVTVTAPVYAGAIWRISETHRYGL